MTGSYQVTHNTLASEVIAHFVAHYGIQAAPEQFMLLEQTQVIAARKKSLTYRWRGVAAGKDRLKN